MSRAAFLFVLLTGLVSATAEAQTVRVKWDREVDFSRYQAYAWEEGTQAVTAGAHELIVRLVDDELAVRGIFKEELEPDLVVVYHASTTEEFEITGGYRRDWQDQQAVTVDSHRAGTLVIDIVDVEENRLFWRGTASATISGDDKKNRRLLQQTVKKMFESFPPQP